jgi:hypothetical protein
MDGECRAPLYTIHQALHQPACEPQLLTVIGDDRGDFGPLSRVVDHVACIDHGPWLAADERLDDGGLLLPIVDLRQPLQPAGQQRADRQKKHW